jgi:predicted enzyme related to lactoylglutathione lyase
MTMSEAQGPNPQGTPIWYELLTDDLARVAPFYRATMGWTIAPQADPAAGGMDYRMIERSGGQRAHDGFAGGAMALTEEMSAGGGRPTWLIYFGVEDVDDAVAEAQRLGASVQMPPMTMDGVGRMAMLADPQGAPFYLMCGDSDESSTVFTGMEPGGCRWNELSTSDAPAAVGFYGALLGGGTDNFMPMEDAGKYVFIECGGQTIGAIGPSMAAEARPAWLPYFGVPDVDAARQAVEANGGTVQMGPMEVPGGDWIVVATDPAGARVGFVGARGS